MAANTEIERVRERIDIVDVVGGHVPLKKAGRSYKGLCPFHQEKSPSFIVFPETQSFHCFGCGQGGDAFTFLMKVEGLEFKDALARLAAKAGVELTQRTSGAPLVDAHRQRLYEATAAAAVFFSHVLTQAQAGTPGRALLEERGITQESVERFGLGFAPEGWEGLRTFLREREIPEPVALEAGLLSERAETGSVYDRFRGRLMFPIRDREGRVLGFGGRALAGGQPKYLNSPQSPIFDKSAILYGIDVAAAAIKRQDRAVLVEGYIDALMAHQFGHGNVVASMGTALTEQQVGLLKPLTKRLVLALDADTAGQMATLRGIETLRETLADDVRPVPDARGLVHFERRLSAEIRVMTLPVGEDPDSLLRKDAAAWPALVEAAEPLTDYVMRAVLGTLDLSQPRAKSEAVQRLAPLLRELGDAVQQAHYIGLLSRRLGIDERTIGAEVRRSALREARRAVQVAVAEARALVTPEDYLMSLLLRYPEVAAELTGTVAPGDFTDTRNRLLWDRLRDQAAGAAAAEWLAADLDEGLAEHRVALLERDKGAPELPPAIAREQIVATLKKVRAERERQQREYWLGVLREVETGGEGPDLATVQQNLAVLAEGSRHRAYYPPKSPYFKDIRDRE